MSGQSCDKASGAMRKTEADFFSTPPRLLPKIHALAAQYSGSTDDFDDLVQEGMIALFQSTALFDPARGVPFDAFALICIKRRLITAAKKNADIPRSNIRDLEDAPDMLSNFPAPDEYALGQEGFETVRNLLINLLSDYELKVLSLYLKGHSYSEIATMLHKSEKSVDNALTRVKAKLSRNLSGN